MGLRFRRYLRINTGQGPGSGAIPGALVFLLALIAFAALVAYAAPDAALLDPDEELCTDAE